MLIRKVLVAGLIVKSLPLDYVKWLVVVVVIYTASMMIRSAILEKQTAAAQMVSPSAN